MKRNTHADFSSEVYGKAKKSPANFPKKIARTYIAWIFSKLANGERVVLPGLGVIHATLRKERRNVGTYKAFQPARYVLKFKASQNIKNHLIQLAKHNQNAFK